MLFILLCYEDVLVVGTAFGSLNSDAFSHPLHGILTFPPDYKDGGPLMLRGPSSCDLPDLWPYAKILYGSIFPLAKLRIYVSIFEDKG